VGDAIDNLRFWKNYPQHTCKCFKKLAEWYQEKIKVFGWLTGPWKPAVNCHFSGPGAVHAISTIIVSVFISWFNSVVIHFRFVTGVDVSDNCFVHTTGEQLKYFVLFKSRKAFSRVYDFLRSLLWSNFRYCSFMLE